jgi:hypothetical protein
MPPPIPIYALDFKGKSRYPGVNETRAGMLFAEINLSKLGSFSADDLQEFGKTVYGPLRPTADEAKQDYIALKQSVNKGSNALRRTIAKYASLGGTRSYPNPSVKPMLMSNPSIVVSMTSNSTTPIRTSGIRRPKITVVSDDQCPIRIMERVIDLLTDLLSSVVDSQLDILPPETELLQVIKFALSRDKGVFPVANHIMDKYIIPLVSAFLETAPWSDLKPPRPSSDDLQVIHGFLSQFMDRARQADIAGERKQIRRVNKVNRSRKIVKHTLNVTNISKDINEQALFELFESGLSTEDSKAVYKTIIVRDVSTGESRGYGRVIFRNAKATLAALNNHQWEIGGRHLYLERVQTENQNDSSEDEVHAGLYDFLPSPKKPKLSSFRLPKIMEEKILQVVGMHANGCPIGDIPTLVEGLDFAKYGFASLTQALRSIDGIKVDKKHLVHL